MKARLGDTLIAEAGEDELVRIEGNWYFPPASITPGVLVESPTPYTCAWKGAAQYFHVVVDGQQIADLAWSYPDLKDGAVEKVGTDFAGYVAFAKDVEISD